MRTNKESVQNKGTAVTRLAKKLGEKSVSETCFWCVHQPRVPESMKNAEKK